MKQNGLEVISSLTELVQRYERMEKFLEQIWRCGDAYSVDAEALAKFLNQGNHPWGFTPKYPGQSPTPGWWELREILRPDFDDSE
jgi:hypothetical protein